MGSIPREQTYWIKCIVLQVVLRLLLGVATSVKAENPALDSYDTRIILSEQEQAWHI